MAKEFLIFLHLHQTSVALDSSSAMAPAMEAGLKWRSDLEMWMPPEMVIWGYNG